MFSVPSQPRTSSQVYAGFRGVDMTSDALNIDRSRASRCQNMISDMGGNPEKRVGWRTLHGITGKINGLHPCILNGTQYIVIHAGTALYLYDCTTNSAPVSLKTGVYDGRSAAFTMNERLYILTGAEYLCIDWQTNAVCTEVFGYIPTTSISRTASGGGTKYEDVNLIQAKRTNTFVCDGTAKTYTLDAKNIDSVDEVKINDVLQSGYTADLAAGTVTFTTAPTAPPVLAVAGRDNLSITFSRAVSGNADKIKKCSVAAMYREGYVFVAGSPDAPNTDYRCAYEDPTYFPDLNYHKIGNDSTAIMGYCHVGQSLAIVKEDSRQEPSIYMRTGNYNGEKMVFSVSQGVAGVGAVSHSFGNLLGDPLFLSASGVYAICSNTITDTQLVQNRSHYVDSVLSSTDLSQAVMCAWRGYMIIAVGENAYILDGNQNKSYKTNDGGNYVYECYHWDNIPAVSMVCIGDALYFGTADGRLCRFNNDMVDSSNKIMMSAFSDDGAPIKAYWATLADDDGFIGAYKTLRKRGCSVTIKPFARSSVNISVRTDMDFGRILRTQTMDVFSWEDLDFERFTFNSQDAPQTVMFNAKVKKYQTAQIIVGNDCLNEAFGVYKIEKVYSVGGYSKR